MNRGCTFNREVSIETRLIFNFCRSLTKTIAPFSPQIRTLATLSPNQAVSEFAGRRAGDEGLGEKVRCPSTNVLCLEAKRLERSLGCVKINGLKLIQTLFSLYVHVEPESKSDRWTDLGFSTSDRIWYDVAGRVCVVLLRFVYWWPLEHASTYSLNCHHACVTLHNLHRGCNRVSRVFAEKDSCRWLVDFWHSHRVDGFNDLDLVCIQCFRCSATRISNGEPVFCCNDDIIRVRNCC